MEAVWKSSLGTDFGLVVVELWELSLSLRLFDDGRGRERVEMESTSVVGGGSVVAASDGSSTTGSVDPVRRNKGEIDEIDCFW